MSGIVLFLFFIGCDVGHHLVMEEPLLESIEPPVVCSYAEETRISVRGSGMLPMVKDVTGSSEILIPQISLIKSQEMDGSQPSSAAAVVIPGGSGSEEASHVAWISENLMRFDIVPDLGLTPGVYSVTVTNPEGSSSTLRDAFLFISPPVVYNILPRFGCTHQKNLTLEVDGRWFFIYDSRRPVTTIEGGSDHFQAVTDSDCHSAAGIAGDARLCKHVSFDLPADFITEESWGDYRFFISSLPDGTCYSISSDVFTYLPPTRVDEVSPPVVCVNDESRTISVRGAGFVKYPFHLPNVMVETAKYDVDSLDDCSEIPVPAMSMESCRGLSFTAPRASASYVTSSSISVINSSPIDCPPGASSTLTIVPPPRVDSIAPAQIGQEDLPAPATLSGQFYRIGDENPLVNIGDDYTLPALDFDGCERFPWVKGDVTACSTLSFVFPDITVVQSTSFLVSVTNPPPAGCTSREEVVVEIVKEGE